VEAATTAAVASAFSLVVAAAGEAAVEATGAGSVVGWFGATDVSCHIKARLNHLLDERKACRELVCELNET